MDFKQAFKKNRGAATMVFACAMGLWLGVLLMTQDYSFLHLYSIFSGDVNVPETLIGLYAFASALMGFLGISIEKKFLQVASLCLLTWFFVFVGILLSYPVLALGSSFIIVGIMCAWSAYRRVLNE